MRKIPTLFLRDARGKIYDEFNPDCWWVTQTAGVATRKYDGTAVLVDRGNVYVRRTVLSGHPSPPGFIGADIPDPVTGKQPGWMPVDWDAPTSRWLREAIEESLPDGSYELVGPKINGNPEKLDAHVLIRHAHAQLLGTVPYTFTGLAEYLKDFPYEGVVWHHPDGRMAKIKRRDYGYA